MDQERQSRWRPTRRQVLWTVGIVVALCVVLYVLIRIGYTLPWTGFGQTEVKDGVKPSKTLWDWLKLLIVPLVLGLGGYFLNSSQNRATQAAADRRAQDEALQAYLDQMSAMLIPQQEQPSLSDEHPPDSLKTVARARTLTVLPRLDGVRKARVVQFLYESGLIAKDHPILSLIEADLNGADLRKTNLSGADLIKTDLSNADLSNANLSDADLSEADLSNADLSEADLSYPVLMDANLSNANLSHAVLMDANLSRANLMDANLSNAVLRYPVLGNASMEGNERADEQFIGATMPDGQVLKGIKNPDGPTFTEWLKGSSL